MVQKNKKSKKRAYWLMLVVLFVVTGGICGLLWYLNSDTKNDMEAVVIEEEKQDAIVEVVTESQEEAEDDVLKKVVQYEGEDPNETGVISGVITYAGVSDGYLRIRLNIDQFLESGTCELSILDGDNVVYTDTVAVSSSAATSTCEGFDIDESAVGVGDFTIKIKVEADEKSGEIVGEVTL